MPRWQCLHWVPMSLGGGIWTSDMLVICELIVSSIFVSVETLLLHIRFRNQSVLRTGQPVEEIPRYQMILSNEAHFCHSSKYAD